MYRKGRQISVIFATARSTYLSPEYVFVIIYMNKNNHNLSLVGIKNPPTVALNYKFSIMTFHV